MQLTTDYKGLIFDSGNVIFECSFDKAINYWAKLYNVDFNTIKTQFVFDEIYERFERNQISPTEYKRHISKMINVEFKNNEFEDGWNSIYGSVIPGISQLLISSCSFHAGIALTIAGRFGLGGSIHPFALQRQIQYGGVHF